MFIVDDSEQKVHDFSGTITPEHLKMLRDLHGLTFKQACQRLGLPTQLRLVPRAVDPHKLAMQVARSAFATWQDERAALLHDTRRRIDDARHEAELFFRIGCRWPDLIKNDEYSRIVTRLGAVYDKLAVLNCEIELTVDQAALLECFRTWQAESGVQHG